MVGADGVWIALDRAAVLGQDDGAAVHQLVPLSLTWARRSAQSTRRGPQPGWAANEIVYTHALRVLENAEFHVAITDIHNGTNVLHFAAELIDSDTVTVMLQTLHTVFDSLGFERSSTN